MKGFKRSQKAHERLARKHLEKSKVANLQKRYRDYDKHFILHSYHTLVAAWQDSRKRKLTQEEKKRAYNDVIKTFY